MWQLAQSILFPSRFYHMTDCDDRVMKEHPRSGKAHDLTNFIPHLWLIAVHFTIGAKSFCFHKRTFITSLNRICLKLSTRRTKILSCMMLLSTVKIYHLRDKFLLSFPLSLYVFLHIYFLTAFTIIVLNPIQLDISAFLAGLLFILPRINSFCYMPINVYSCSFTFLRKISSCGKHSCH